MVFTTGEFLEVVIETRLDCDLNNYHTMGNIFIFILYKYIHIHIYIVYIHSYIYYIYTFIYIYIYSENSQEK